MSLRNLSDSDVEMFLELWRNERAFWNVNFPKCSNADEQKAALSKISHQMDDVDARTSVKLNFSKLYTNRDVDPFQRGPIMSI